MSGQRFYYHTQFNRRVRLVDLNEVDFDALGGEPKTMLMDEDRAEDVDIVNFKR